MIEAFIKIAAKQFHFEKYSVRSGIYLMPDWDIELKLFNETTNPVWSDIYTGHIAYYLLKKEK